MIKENVIMENKIEKNTYKEITIKVLSQTEEFLKKVSELIEGTMGEIVDIMSLNWAAKDPSAAALLILEHLITHTHSLTEEELLGTYMLVLGVIKKSIKQNEEKVIEKLADEIDRIISNNNKIFPN